MVFKEVKLGRYGEVFNARMRLFINLVEVTAMKIR